MFLPTQNHILNKPPSKGCVFSSEILMDALCFKISIYKIDVMLIMKEKQEVFFHNQKIIIEVYEGNMATKCSMFQILKPGT